ncbi:hypothetical protein [Halomonas sp. M20]|uniref:hypothetical protein n=1 Tax=Halomonas sp. M20 TaxID=2763264 RepID=UPI001D09CAB5|nr:hypothetical protein [Halomonas sp. M20]
MWARIHDGTVAEITDKDPEGRFHPSIEWVVCHAQVVPGWSFDGATFAAPPAASLGDLAAAAMGRINDGYTRALGGILDEYPAAETPSFDKQEREARGWQEWHAAGADPGTEPPTPYLDAMLAERPIGKAELVGRIIAKADAYVTAHGSATGRRHRLEDDVKAAQLAEDRAALEKIDW